MVSTLYLALAAGAAFVTSAEPCTSEDGTMRQLRVTELGRMYGDAKHTCAVFENDKLMCWGGNWGNQLGHDGANVGGSVQPFSETSFVEFPKPVKHVFTGFSSTTVITTDNELHRWGDFVTWRNVATSNNTLVAVDEGRYVADVAMSNYFFCVVLDDKNVKCAGDNVFMGLTPTEFPQLQTTPTVDFGEANGTVVKLGVGSGHACALLESNEVRCWGGNSKGELGVGTTTTLDKPTTPVDFGDGEYAVDLSVGGRMSCAITNSGKLICWGDLCGTDDEQLGTLPEHIPLQTEYVDFGADTPVSVHRSPTTTCVRLASGAAKCWNCGTDQQIGFVDATPFEQLPNLYTDGVQEMTVGYYRICSIIGEDNELQCTGRNTAEEPLGVGNSQYYYNENPSAVPVLNFEKETTDCSGTLSPTASTDAPTSRTSEPTTATQTPTTTTQTPSTSGSTPAPSGSNSSSNSPTASPTPDDVSGVSRNSQSAVVFSLCMGLLVRLTN